MKSKKEWRISIEKRNLNSGQFLEDQIQLIQLDAMKEGMRRAAELSRNHKQFGVCCGDGISETILTAAEKLTEKDL